MICPVCNFDNLDGARMCEDCGMMLPLPGSEEIVTDKSVVGIIPGMTLQKRYLIKKEAGSGGMGKVFLAEDKNIGDRLCIIKQNNVLEESGISEEDAKELFFREASLLAMLNFPGIPKVWDYFEEDSLLFLVEEWIEGETLEEKCRNKQINKLEIMETFLHLCSILEYIHSRTPMIIHRDIKPQNIIITEDKGPYLIDFGISRTFKKHKKRDTIKLGTEGYSSPEQFEGKTDNRSDIYSLGASLWFGLTGKDPGKYQWKLPDVKSIRKNISDEFAEIVNKSVNPVVENRYQKIEIMKDELQSILNRKAQDTEALSLSHLEEWRQFKGSPFRIGYSNMPVKNKPKLLWKTELKERIFTSPLAYSNNILIFTESGNINWLHLQKGSILDNKNIGYKLRSTPAIVGNILYMATFEGFFLIYSLDNDIITRKIKTGARVPSPILNYGDQIIVAGNRENRGMLYSFNLKGDINWKKSLTGKVGASPVYGEGKVFIGDSSGEFYALNAKTGKALWRNYSEKGIKNTAIYVNNQIFTGTGEGKYYCINPKNGRVKWERDLDCEIIGSPSWFDGIIIITTAGGGVYALEEKSGSILWSSHQPFTSLAPPVIFRRNVILSEFEGGKVFCKNIENGENVWNIDLNGRVISSPLPANNSLVLETLEGNIFSFAF